MDDKPIYFFGLLVPWYLFGIFSNSGSLYYLGMMRGAQTFALHDTSEFCFFVFFL